MKTHSLPPTELNCRLSATYPWVPVKKDDPDVIKFPPGSSNPYVKDGKVLINDPNNDGYLITVFPGLAVGAVVDGSGCGLRARLAANIVLAVLYEMIGGLVDIFKNSSPAPVASSDIYNWMQKVIVNAHRRIKKTTEAGSTTASFFILSKTSQTTKNSNNDVTSDGLNHKYTCFFAATGDVEAFFYSKKQNKWKYLFRDPSRFDALRIDPSHTPGGLG